MKFPKNKLLLPVAIIAAAFFFATFLVLEYSGKSVNGTLAADEVVYGKIPTAAGKINFIKQSANLTKPVDPELVDLDNQIISCAPNVDGLLGENPVTGGSCAAGPTALATTTGLYMGGGCCGALTDMKDYHENLQKLQAYKDTPNIPLDPMHTPIAMAKYWIDYDKATTLAPDKQKIYDEAYAISKKKPCCCKCWHYFVNEGIAKQMIINGTWSSRKIAAYWDASDICG